MNHANNIGWQDEKQRRPLSEEKLRAYYNGSLSHDEQHEVELWLHSEGMESDALEGLSVMNTEEMQHSVNHLNRKLKKQLHNNQSKRKGIQGIEWNLITIVIVIVLLLAAFAVLFALLKK